MGIRDQQETVLICRVCFIVLNVNTFQERIKHDNISQYYLTSCLWLSAASSLDLYKRLTSTNNSSVVSPKQLFYSNEQEEGPQGCFWE